MLSSSKAKLNRTELYERYVGRSDDDLNARLERWVDSKYSCFTFEYCSSPNAAFVKECTLYHHLGGSEKLDNKTHPQGSTNSD